VQARVPFEQLLVSLYSAASGSSPWSCFLADAGAFLGAHALALTVLSPNLRDVLVMAAHNLGGAGVSGPLLQEARGKPLDAHGAHASSGTGSLHEPVCAVRGSPADGVFRGLLQAPRHVSRDGF